LLLRQIRALARLWKVETTFDDAYRSAARILPVLQQSSVPVELFVCTGYARAGAPLTIPELARDDPTELATMTWAELRSHAEDGVQIGSHGVWHAHLPQLSDAEVRAELTDSRQAIEDELRRPCPDFAYPYGEHDERTRKLVRLCGYERAFALREGSRRDPFAQPRLDLYRRHTPAKALVGAAFMTRAEEIKRWLSRG
jgi:peptidoglycan/xylan/chitin deacetylase (PgdA/CDA1 family)